MLIVSQFLNRRVIDNFRTLEVQFSSPPKMCQVTTEEESRIMMTSQNKIAGEPETECDNSLRRECIDIHVTIIENSLNF